MFSCARIHFAALLAVVFAMASLADDTPRTLNVISYNVLVEISHEKGVPSWDERKALAVETLKKQGPDLIGMQENTPNQRDYFAYHPQPTGEHTHP